MFLAHHDNHPGWLELLEMKPLSPKRRGLSLMELVIVVAILVALAALAVPLISSTVGDSQLATTMASMHRLQDTIANRYWPEMEGIPAGADGYPQPLPSDSSRVPHPQLVFLFLSPGGPSFDPVSRRGWHGPYLQHNGGRYAVNVAAGFTLAYGLNDDAAVNDGWGRPIVLQRPTEGTTQAQTQYARLVSAGTDGILQTPIDKLLPTKTACGDDLVLFVRVPDQRAP